MIDKQLKLSQWYYMDTWDHRGFAVWSEHLLLRVNRIRKRLSGNHLYSCTIVDFNRNIEKEETLEHNNMLISDMKAITEDEMRLLRLLLE